VISFLNTHAKDFPFTIIFVKLFFDERKCCQLDYMKRKIYLTLLCPLLSMWRGDREVRSCPEKF
jgi:hypothetical protein